MASQVKSTGDGQGLAGGISAPKPATEEIQGYIDQVKPQVEKAVGRILNTYIATEYCYQVVNGTNYFVKVDVGDNKFIQVNLFRTLDGDITFISCQDGKTKDDKITLPK